MSHIGYFIFEGPDGCGKTTIMKKVQEKLTTQHEWKLNRNIISTRAPGFTEFGAKMREIVLSNPSIDPLTRQVLYMADTINYYESFLKNVNYGDIILQDRTSYISSVVYGVSDGVPISNIARVLSIYKPMKADCLFVINVPKDVRESRKKADSGRVDYFESKPIEFHDSVDGMYRSLISDDSLRLIVSDIVHLDDVVYLNNFNVDHVADDICDTIIDYINRKFGV